MVERAERRALTRLSRFRVRNLATPPPRPARVQIAPDEMAVWAQSNRISNGDCGGRLCVDGDRSGGYRAFFVAESRTSAQYTPGWVGRLPHQSLSSSAATRQRRDSGVVEGPRRRRRKGGVPSRAPWNSGKILFAGFW